MAEKDKRKKLPGSPQTRADVKRFPHPKQEGVWPITYRLVAVGTLVAYSALGAQKLTLAQSIPRSSGTKSNLPQTQNASTTKHFDIAAGPISELIPEFESASGLHIVLDNPAIGNVQSPGLHGEYSDEEALNNLLKSTSVSYRFSGPGLVQLNLASLQQTLTVDATPLQLDQVDSAKYTAPILDTPQSISVMPQQMMEQQNTTTLRDTLRNVAGISLAAGEGGSQGDNLTIRGFTARNDIFLDGERDFGSYYRDTFNQQEVQVLEGPSAVTFGRGTTGGVVNEVSKSPQLEPFIRGNATFGSDVTRRINVDINEPLATLVTGSAFRLNLMGDDNKVADRDFAEYRRFGFAPSLALGVGTPTRVVFSYFHQSEDDTPDYGIPWLFDRPAPVNRQNYYGFRDANFLRTNDDIVTTTVEHDFGKSITIRNEARYANEKRSAQITEAQIPTTTTLATPLSSITVTRNQINVDSTESMLDEQFDSTFRFNTGFLKHTLVTGVEAVRETSDPMRNTITGVPATSLLNPNESQPYAGISVPSTAVHVNSTTFGTYLLDTVELGSKFDLTGGGRWDRFGTDYSQSVAPPSAFSQVERLPTWRGASVYTPKTSASIYVAAGNSFDPSAETLSLSAANANTPPEKNMTYEVGSKWDLAANKLSVTGSIFRTDKTNAREPDPNNPLQNVLGGHERVTGTQISLTGHLTNRWELLSSYAYLCSTVVGSTYYPASVGAPLANVPRNTFNFWSTYTAPWKRLQLGAGGNYVDSRTASSTVPYDPATGLLKEVRGYWVLNAMAAYPLNERASVQLNLNNLTNKYYYDQIHPAHIVPGAGFTALAGINFKF